MSQFKLPIDEFIQIRRTLHANPELGCEEHQTAQRVVDYLSKFKPDDILTGLGGTGVAAVYNGKNPGKTIAVRCELDALPIHEINDVDYVSKHKGISHVCGHDGHMTIVLGLAAYLHHEPPVSGRVILLFQPSEEDGRGAAAILDDPAFQTIEPDYIVALHNLPGFPTGQIVVKTESFTPAVNSIIIRFSGKTAHAGEPHNGKNPALAIAEVLNELNKWVKTDISDPEFCLVTPIYMHMGEKAYGVSAGYGEVHLTIRCLTNEMMRELEQKAEELVQEIARKHGLGLDTEWVQSFFANQNDETIVSWIRKSGSELGYEVIDPKVPFGFGEDFGLFTERYTGAMFGLGAGVDTPSLHNPDYNFPEEIIENGVQMFRQIIRMVPHE